MTRNVRGNMKPQHKLITYLRFKRHYMACDEVSNYGNIADVIALDKNKRHVLEFEFKKSARDLKVLEQKKRKYRFSSWVKWPHKFYFVVPEKLWKKEKEYLESLKKDGIGTVIYFKSCGKLDFLIAIPSKLRTENVQNYDVVLKNFLARCTSAYAKLLTTHFGKEK